MDRHEPSEALLITADTHIGEPEELRQRLPEELRPYLPRFVPGPDGDLDIEIGGKRLNRPRPQLTAYDLEHEFRSDPSLGTDLAVRLRDMTREGVDAQVVFPNFGLGCGGGRGPSVYYEAWARAYNDWVWELFSDVRECFKPAAMLPVDNVEQTVEEARRCIARGFPTLFVPAVVPWQPYRMETYEPLWSLVEEARIPINFHVFSGNLALGGEFGDVSDMSGERIERAKQVARAERAASEQFETVIGMAAGMAPILELTGAGVLERHPDLRFVVTEAECGWLPWVLQAMDQMQKRRHIYMRRLPLRASEYFLRQGAVTITDDTVALNNVELIGADCLLWGNDYPHDEGTWPNSGPFIDEIKSKLSPDDARKVLCENAARLYGFDLDYLSRRRSEALA